MAARRLLDILLAGGALILLMPSFLALAALVKLTSRGPVFSREPKMLGGKPFVMLKFRSTLGAAGKSHERSFADTGHPRSTPEMSPDTRVTRLGRFMRKYSIDKLPQLINVLHGDMSMVGLRPRILQQGEEHEPGTSTDSVCFPA